MVDTITAYAIKANLTLAFIYLIYFILFRRNTFHQINRFILVGSVVLSIVVPFVKVQSEAIVQAETVSDIIMPVFEGISQETQELLNVDENKSGLSTGSIIYGLYLLIFLGLFGRLLFQIFSICDYRKHCGSARSYATNTSVYSGEKASFTFFRWVFLNNEIQSDTEKEYVFRHELAHAHQLHSIDRLLVELICIVFWFNPFVYLLRRSVITIHEYLADQSAACNNAQKIDYMQVLVSGIYPKAELGISSNFQWALIKKRINMITRSRTSKYHKISYLLFIPLLALIVQSFSVDRNKLMPEIMLGSFVLPVDTVPNMSPIKQEDLIRTASGWGYRVHPIYKAKKFHYGLDLIAPTGTKIYSTADGTITSVVKSSKGYGNKIIVDHGLYKTLYAHLSAFKVKLGDTVMRGDVIGFVGNTGTSTVAHLHYEVIKGKKKVNPAKYLGK